MTSEDQVTEGYCKCIGLMKVECCKSANNTRFLRQLPCRREQEPNFQDGLVASTAKEPVHMPFAPKRRPKSGRKQ